MSSIEAPKANNAEEIRERYKDIPADQLQRLAEGTLSDADMNTIPTTSEGWTTEEIQAVAQELLQEKTKE